MPIGAHSGICGGCWKGVIYPWVHSLRKGAHARETILEALAEMRAGIRPLALLVDDGARLEFSIRKSEIVNLPGARGGIGGPAAQSVGLDPPDRPISARYSSLRRTQGWVLVPRPGVFVSPPIRNPLTNSPPSPRLWRASFYKLPMAAPSEALVVPSGRPRCARRRMVPGVGLVTLSRQGLAPARWAAHLRFASSNPRVLVPPGTRGGTRTHTPCGGGF